MVDSFLCKDKSIPANLDKETCWELTESPSDDLPNDLAIQEKVKKELRKSPNSILSVFDFPIEYFIYKKTDQNDYEKKNFGFSKKIIGKSVTNEHKTSKESPLLLFMFSKKEELQKETC